MEDPVSLLSFIERLKQRKVVEWTLAYLAGAWVVFEATGTAAEIWDIPLVLLRSIHVLLVMGIFAAVIVSWFHGEKGRQHLGRLEVMELAVVLLVAGSVVAWVGRAGVPEAVADGPSTEGIRSLDGADHSRPRVVLVLPFENRSSRDDDQYFVDGMYDEVLTRLQDFPQLQVVSRSTAERYRGSEVTTADLQARHALDYLVEGGVQRAGDRIRVNVQLIDPRTDSHVWADTWDRELTLADVLDVQTEIARRIAQLLRGGMGRAEAHLDIRGSTTSLRAYELALQADAEFDRDLKAGLPDGGDPALALLDEVVTIDPDYAYAYYLIAIFELTRAPLFRARGDDRSEAIRTAVHRLQRLAPESPYTYRAMTKYLRDVEGDVDEALLWLRRSPTPLHGEQWFLNTMAGIHETRGDWADALTTSLACLEVAPQNEPCWNQVIGDYTRLRRFDEAWAAHSRRIDEAGIVTADGPGFIHSWLSWARDGDPEPLTREVHNVRTRGKVFMVFCALLSVGRFEDALTFLESTDVDWLRWTPISLLRGLVLHELDRTEEAQHELAQALELMEDRFTPSPDHALARSVYALALAAHGDTAAAIREASTAAEQKDDAYSANDRENALFLAAAALARVGRTAEAVEVLERLMSAPSLWPPAVVETHYLTRPLWDDPDFRALIEAERGRVF